MRLATRDFETLIQFAINAEQWFSERGLELHVGDDFKYFQKLLDRLDYDRYEHRNPGFDPRFTDVGPRNAFYLEIEQDGEPVATVAGRVAEVEDFGHFLDSGRIFYGRGLKPADFECALVCDKLRGISGAIGIGASAFVVPRLQNKNAPSYMRGIATRIVLLMRSMVLRQFQPDFYTALIRDTLIHKGMDKGTYRHKRGAELWLNALDGRIYGVLETPPEVLAGLATFLAQDQEVGADSMTRPVTVLPPSLTGQTPPM